MTTLYHRLIDDVDALLARSHALGSDGRVTNFAGGNTSCKAVAVDPVTGERITVLWVKGSGADLGTLAREGLASLVLERVLALRDRYTEPAREDEMFALLDHCRYGTGGAPPSIDTALHAFLPPAHVDHVHPDAVISLAAARDGEFLVKECYGRAVTWLPWCRPGFELALRMAATYRSIPDLLGIVLGGHGLFAWGDTSEECQVNTFALVARAEQFLADRGKPEPFGPIVIASSADRNREAARLGPLLRGLCSTDHRVVGSFSGSPHVLDFMSRREAPRLAALGTSCPDHFLRTKVRPLFVDQPSATRIRELHSTYRAEYQAYYEAHARTDSPPMRGADPHVVLVRGVGMWSFGPDAQAARVASDYFENAVNVMRGAEALSRYEPIPDGEKFGVEYWPLEEAKLRRRPPAPPLAGRVALVTGAGSGIGRAIARRLSGGGAAVVVADIEADRAASVALELAEAVAVTVDVADESLVDEAFAKACLAYGGVDIVINNAGLSVSRPLTETSSEDWDRQHRVMARGSFLVSRAAARLMIEQLIGGDIVYVCSKNAVAAGPGNVAYGAAKADQAHQVRLLATELGQHKIRVNGVNPDAVVRDSGIFAGSWAEQRAAVHGVAVEDLGRFYAERTLLKEEVLPEHVAAAVFALVAGDLPLTTGTILPVDGGIPAAFLR